MESFEDKVYPMMELRKIMDGIDDEIIKLLAKRKFMSQKIGEIKKRHSLPIHDEERRVYVEGKWGEFAQVYQTIHNLSKEYQK
jgi:chorismate mutase